MLDEQYELDMETIRESSIPLPDGYEFSHWDIFSFGYGGESINTGKGFAHNNLELVLKKIRDMGDDDNLVINCIYSHPDKDFGIPVNLYYRNSKYNDQYLFGEQIEDRISRDELIKIME